MNVKFKKSGIVQAGNFSDASPVYDMKLKNLSDGSSWARIFYHNCVGGTVLFSSVNEVLNTQTENKYSRLYLLDEFKASDNKFEFMLCYPDDSTGYNRWKQSNNPCKEWKGTSDGSLYADGYEAVSISWTTSYWGGLTRQNSSETAITACYLSGSVGHGNWFYAIGAASTHGVGIPTWDGSTDTIVELWVRTDTIPKETQMKLFDNLVTSKDFIEL